MKAILLLLGATMAFSCTTEKEVQMDVIDVELVKIETVNRYPNLEQQVLTWRDRNNINYITFEPVNTNYSLGAIMKVLVRK